jgi:hypothetical protein
MSDISQADVTLVTRSSRATAEALSGVTDATSCVVRYQYALKIVPQLNAPFSKFTNTFKSVR